MLLLMSHGFSLNMYIRSGIQSIDGLSVLGDSKLCIIAFTSDKFHVYKIADEMKVHYLKKLHKNRMSTVQMLLLDESSHFDNY